MFKGHPKGLFVAFFANMGERFGFYTMVSIFVLFLQAKYGLTAGQASHVYGIFMFFVYFFPSSAASWPTGCSATARRSASGWSSCSSATCCWPYRRDMEHGLPPRRRRPGRHRPRHRAFQGQPPGAGREPLRRPEIQPAPRPGVQHLLHGHQHRRHVRPDRRGEDQQLDPLGRSLHLRRPHPGPGQPVPQGQARGRRRTTWPSPRPRTPASPWRRSGISPRPTSTP